MSTFLERPQSVLARRALFQVHLWLGVLTGLYIFVVCATGAVLVFRIDIQHATLPALFTPRTAGPLADPPFLVMFSRVQPTPGNPELTSVAWLLLGMAPPVLFVTGFIMWWTRVVRVRWLRAPRPAAETAQP